MFATRSGTWGHRNNDRHRSRNRQHTPKNTTGHRNSSTSGPTRTQLCIETTTASYDFVWNVSKQCSPCSAVAMGRVERDRFTLLRNWSIGRTRPKKEIEKRRYNVKKKGISFFSYEKNINKAKSNLLIHCTSIWSVYNDNYWKTCYAIFHAFFILIKRI